MLKGFRNPGFLLSASLPVSPITPMNYCTSAKGVFDDTTPAQMHDAMMEYRNVCGQKPLALFFHGGLVDKASGMQNAQQLMGRYSATAADNGGNAYPYFFVWESGLVETLMHNLPGILAETIFQRIRDIVGSKAQSILGSPAAGVASTLRTPTLGVTIGPVEPNLQASQDDIGEVQLAVENDPLINIEKRRIARAARPLAQALAESVTTTPRELKTSGATLLSPQIVNAIVAEEGYKQSITPKVATSLSNALSLGSLALGAGNVLVRIIRRYATGRNHNFHNTVAEEIFRQFYIANAGWAVWNEMKVETAQAFQGDAAHNVGNAMIAELIALYESGDAGRGARIVLLGHSTGAVYICNFLAAMQQALAGRPYRDSIKFDVIFMAPAVRVDLLAATLESFGSLVRNFRSFEMSDELESGEILLQVDGASPTVNAILAEVYTSSLLYFISGVLEDSEDDTPIDGMQRFFTTPAVFSPLSFPDVQAVSTFYAGQSDAIVYADTSKLDQQPPLGKRCTSYHHGGFPSDPGTLESVCYLLRTAAFDSPTVGQAGLTALPLQGAPQSTQIDYASMKLGKQPPKKDERTLMLAKYLAPALPAPPPSVDYSTAVKVPWGTMENDQYQDCTCAAAGHLIMDWTSLAGAFTPVTDDQVIQAYAAITGFDPNTGLGDGGAVEIDVLNYWRKTGIAGHQISAYAALTASNTDHVKIATALFCGAYIGLQLPLSAKTQTVWDVPAGGAVGPGAPNSWGGHAVCIVGYDANQLTIITWGHKKQMTWAFWQVYCDEAYALLSKDYLKNQKAPAGVDLATLEQDLQVVTA